jgi:CheY-like chemotaxis protein
LLGVSAMLTGGRQMSELQTAAPELATTLSSPATALALPLVLVADADGDSRVRRARQLQSRGFRVSIARTAFETIVKASCHVPDLILVDASLGDTDVQETTHLLAMCPATAHIPVVRLTPGRRIPARLLSGVAPR